MGDIDKYKMVGTSNTCLESWQTHNKIEHSMHDVSDDPLAFYVI